MFGLRKIFSNVILTNKIKSISHGYSFVRHASQKTGFDNQFIIVRVTPRDFEPVIDLFKYSFFNGEPTMMAAGLSYKSNPVMENILLEGLSEGMSLMAKCRRTGSLVGAAINTGQCPWDPDTQEDFANTCTCPKVADVLRFFAHITRKPNLCEKFHENKIFEITYLATDFNNQGKGIGYHLIQKSIALGKDLTYNVIRLDATNAFSQKLCKKLKMHMVYELPYKEYVNCDGKPVFLPPSPHDSVQVFVTLPHSSPDATMRLLTK